MSKVNSDLIVELQEKVEDFVDDHGEQLGWAVLNRVQRAATLLDEAANIQAEVNDNE